MTAAAVAPVARATSRAPAPPPRGPSRGAVRAGVARRRRRLLRASAVPESSSSSSDGGFGAGVGSSATTSNPLDDHVPIDRFYPGLRQLHASPDVFVVDGFLSDAECDSIVAAAKTRAMDQSPVVYAGWTNDVGDVVSTVARGPAIWGATLAMLATSSTRGPGVGTLGAGALAYAAIVAAAAAGARNRVEAKEKELQGMRTSTSCVLDGGSDGERAYVRNAKALMCGCDSDTFEAPTVIRYEPGQRLAPHFDANRGADVEDANRGGQTLVTMIAYLNDAGDGVTRFGRLNGGGGGAGGGGGGGLEVAPKKGSCLVFFPATRSGAFDDRVEHEGAEAGEEKWICRIWRHANEVRPPFGLPRGYQP